MSELQQFIINIARAMLSLTAPDGRRPNDESLDRLMSRITETRPVEAVSPSEAYNVLTPPSARTQQATTRPPPFNLSDNIAVYTII